MNNISLFMNKIDIRSNPDSALHLESMGLVELGEFWNRITLSGDYWRFYYHDSPGAGVVQNGVREMFKPGRGYLLPPECNLESVCTQNTVQLFIHLNLPGGRCNCPGTVFELPEGFAADDIRTLSEAIADGRSNAVTIRALALAVGAAALSKLPEAWFEVPAMDPRIAAVRDFINTHLEEDMSLEMLAKRVGMSGNNFLRIFRKECGLTPYKYIVQQRYHLAARLLKNSHLSIEEICDVIGIHDRFHFSRQFKNFFGVPPAQYRIRYRG